MKLKKVACAVALLGAGSTFIVPSVIAAPGPGQSAYYIGGSVGQSKYKDIPQGLRNVDDKDTGYKVYGGYQINPNWGVEATYFDLGKFTGNDTAFNGSTVVPVNASAKVQAWGLAGVFTAPISNGFSVFGKLGLARNELKTNASGLGFRAHQKESSTGANFGFGATYDFVPNLAVRAEWERLNKVGDNATTGETDMDFLSAGITFKF
ncbi:outer membrane beta-barrel protein [Candidatus Nitrotoga arctica]|uniref:OmpA_membrane domain-containing protein n=1 Tax=Candidatus Nitrotoga arctica TaxID=453162 RepID=A0ABN8AJ79_9PROT|nr:outer membrane beta-barrel protein [Candidatus Nitrotoga arctica]CAG9931649.1 OmpA_membrane domain-containing protein [Candidatus Nitrotoga arctica]